SHIMEAAEHRPGSRVHTQLCRDVQTDTCTDSKEAISSSLDEQNEELLNIIKVEESEEDGYFGEETSSSLGHDIAVDKQKTNVKEEPENDDEYLYCEECKCFFINKCEVHGPAVFLSDTPVQVGLTNRARLTLPLGLEVRQSNISGAGLGVFNKGQSVPVGVHFGPYEGELVDKEEAMNSGYSWVIYRSRQGVEYIDAKKEIYANWMRYVNCARNGEEQNLVAFQYQGGIHYRCCQPIKPGQELLVWYGEEYPRDHSLEFNCLWNKKSSIN
ncbi:histone-lysine N-methyltransferase PRDM9-like, partial [Clarias magur]